MLEETASEKTLTRSVRLTESVMNKIDEIAKTENVSRSDIINSAIFNHLEQKYGVVIHDRRVINH